MPLPASGLPTTFAPSLDFGSEAAGVQRNLTSFDFGGDVVKSGGGGILNIQNPTTAAIIILVIGVVLILVMRLLK